MTNMIKSQLKRFYCKKSAFDSINMDPFLNNKMNNLSSWEDNYTPRKETSIKKNKLKEFQKFFNKSEKFHQQNTTLHLYSQKHHKGKFNKTAYFDFDKRFKNKSALAIQDNKPVKKQMLHPTEFSAAVLPSIK